MKLKALGGLDVRKMLKKHINVPKAVVRARLDICESCDEFNGSTKICGICKCFMPAKVRLNLQACPKGKWPIVKVSDSSTNDQPGENHDQRSETL